MLLWRGFSLADVCNQCASNHLDAGKGRQMPVHYAATAQHVQTISSPMGTQLLHAVGYGYGLQREHSHRVAVAYFGEGAASEGDCPSALNFAAVLEAPVLFLCRNNGYAISTRASEQYRGDGVSARSRAFGIETYRVDGNDLLAVYHCTTAARHTVFERQRPVLVELMTYRVGHHSTSDDSTRYRKTEEIEWWRTRADPIVRHQRYLEGKGWYTAAEHDEVYRGSVAEVRETLNRAAGEPFAKVSDLFTDVYDTVPVHLREQEQDLFEHLRVHGEHYSLERYLPEATG